MANSNVIAIATTATTEAPRIAFFLSPSVAQFYTFTENIPHDYMLLRVKKVEWLRFSNLRRPRTLIDIYNKYKRAASDSTGECFRLRFYERAT